VFSRADGSMHFIRELYCGNSYRIFDSDFVIRNINGQPTLFEVFVDINVEVKMNISPLPDGGLLIKSTGIYWRGRRIPNIGLQVEFKSEVFTIKESGAVLHIDGHLMMKPHTSTGQFFAHKILRRPENLASIHYTVRTTDSSFK
jgi:hypothetical protein